MSGTYFARNLQSRVETFLRLHAGLARRGYIVCRCHARQKLTRNVVALPWNQF